MTFGLLQWNHHLFSAIFTENAYKVPWEIGRLAVLY